MQLSMLHLHMLEARMLMSFLVVAIAHIQLYKTCKVVTLLNVLQLQLGNLQEIQPHSTCHVDISHLVSAF